MSLFKRLAARLPVRWQCELKRMLYRRQIKHGTFETPEPEVKILSTLIKAGDWVIDIGANVGHYTKRLSEVVGREGRVIAIEPVPTTFSLLSANSQHFRFPNITLLNAAVADKVELVGMTIPHASNGMFNYYEAHCLPPEDGDLSVMTLSIDSLNINHRVSLVKVDAEGYEALVIAGMQKLIADYHPILIVETRSDDVIANVTSLGYSSERLADSPNVLFKPKS
ncbi:MAG TPA: FkbM family methyltransferase [candidate division Zixibacteria bacterium]|nr:FkbM family methyltransferase [candidate division Zixibacteria bacterium]